MDVVRYTEPVKTLLTCGEPGFGDKWPDYLKNGLSQDHIPELIAMLTDESLHQEDSNTSAVWAPLHAWRALGQLQAVEAIPALLDQLYRIDEEDDDWVNEELPEVFGMIGAAAIPGLTNYLSDLQHPLFARICAAYSLPRIGILHPEARQSCIIGLEEQLKKYHHNDSSLNGFLICCLTDLKAVEALDTIQQAYDNECVDLSIMGDYEDVEIDFGIRDSRSKPRPPMWWFKDGDEYDEDWDIEDDEPAFDLTPPSKQPSIRVKKKKIGRNDPCPCGSGKKYKKCCLNKKG